MRISDWSSDVCSSDLASARIYDMQIPYSVDEINAACREVLRRNELGKGYLRPLAYRGLGGFGLSADTPIDVIVAAWHMGPYLGEGVLEQGIDARSEEQTSELTSLMRISFAVFCLTKK